MASIQMDRMSNARAGLLLKHPFWGALALYLTLEENPKIESMSTNGEILRFNPEFVATLSDREVRGVIAHEISHLAYSHHTRRGNRELDQWNDACDYAINQDLLKAGFTLPGKPLVDDRFRDMVAEEIYSVLIKEKPPQQKPQQGQPRAGQGQGQGQPQPGGQAFGQAGQGPQQGQGQGNADRPGKIEDAAAPGDVAGQAQAQAEWKVRVAQATAAQRGKNAGNVPAEIQRVFDNAKKQQVDWRAVLRRFIDEKNRTDYSWQRPNKRLMNMGFIVPGQVPDGINHIGVAVDTSGSIDNKALGLFVRELQAAVDDGCVRKLTVVCCDTSVKAHHEFEEGQRIEFKPMGGGGTKFAPAIKWFEKNEPDISALIYFTDLACSDYGDEPLAPVLWVGYGKANEIHERSKCIPFGEVIPLVD